MSFKILTKIQHKILTKLQLQNFNLNILTKNFTSKTPIPQLQNLDWTVVNMFFRININNTNNINKFWVGIFKSQSHISQDSTISGNDWVSLWWGKTMIKLGSIGRKKRGVQYIIHKVNRCLAIYSPHATTTSRPTNRAPNKPAWPGPNWPTMPILGQIWSFLGKKSFFLLEKS